MVPDASPAWVFRGLHQRQVEQRFASYGANASGAEICGRAHMRRCRASAT
jgi:hypothetical protein